MPDGNGDVDVARATATGRFEFATAQRIVFGAGTRAELPALVAGLGRRVLFVGGANPHRHAELLAAARAAAESLVVFSVPGEPTVALVEEGTRLARSSGCTVVVAVGGVVAPDCGDPCGCVGGAGSRRTVVAAVVVGDG